MNENKHKFHINLFAKSDTQPSLFHYIKETPDSSVFAAMDWSFLWHPISSFKEAWRSPRCKPSLFHYCEDEKKAPFSWKEFCSDLVTGFRNPLFIPSVFSNPESLALERSLGRTRKWEAGMFSVFVHAALIIFLAFWAIKSASRPGEVKPNIIDVATAAIISPYEGEKGGGGSGNHERAAPATGRLPQTSRIQTVLPAPDTPHVLLPADELLAQVATVQIPFTILQDQSLPIGDFTAPPNGSLSLGPGNGGSIGSGDGTGIGSGKGAGAGPGKDYGIGGGPGGPGGSSEPMIPGRFGVKEPVVLVKPLPPYTEEARKARAMGAVLIQAIIRKDGSVDGFKVIRGLGYGLDESAIKTISTKWRFSPGTYNGAPVDVRANIEVYFSMY